MSGMTRLLEAAISAHNGGALELAAKLYEDLLNAEPDHFRALSLLGVLKGQLEEPAQGVALLERALALDPENGDANANMGLMLSKLGRHAQAIGFLTKAIETHPENLGYLQNLAFVLVSFEKPDDAIDVADILLSLDPKCSRAYHARGNALLLKSDARAALENYEIALEAHADDPRLWSNLGVAHRWLKNGSEALRCHETALALAPSSMDARWERALTLLTFGQFEAGWRDYVSAKAERSLPARPKLGEVWDGDADLQNKSIFVYREQGLGDTIQFCRFVRHLSDAGARVLFAPHAPLKWLMGTMAGGVEICDFADPDLQTDYHVPLLSLPAWFPSHAPASQAPYLFPLEDNVDKWRARLGAQGFRIGVCWQGSIGKADYGRSFPLAHFHALSRLPGVRLISLHRGDGEAQLQSLPADMRIETLGADFDSGPDGFFDTAAVMKVLDLVITSDTAVAHLAGALGAPVWVALKSAPDWRWMIDRPDSPWYPTMRLFRQQTAGDWAGVFAQMETALQVRL